jgi:purine-nucleoside phosphorylase
MSADTARVAEAARAVRVRSDLTPVIGVVLGSGLGAFADELLSPVRIPFEEIPHMPEPGVSGHAGVLWLGMLGNHPVACLQGRVHLYEGHEPDDVVFGVRLLAELGCKAVLLTNAAGGVTPSLLPGSLMLISDHLNFTGKNPLSGADLADALKFIDMTAAYDADLAAAARVAAVSLNMPLKQGVYAGLLGPSYETPAEIRWLERAGADAVGMSTVCEVIALRQRGVRVGAVSYITNFAAGRSSERLDHEDVKRVALEGRESFLRFMTAWVARALET